MTVPVLQSVAAKGSGTNVATTTGVDTTGCVAFRMIAISQSNAAPTFSDSKSNAWAADGSPVQLNATFTAYVHASKCTTASPTVGASHTFTCTGNDAVSVWMIGLKPGTGGDPISITAWSAQADASSPYTSPSAVTSDPDALLIVFGTDDGSGSPITLTWDSSFSSVASGAVTDQNSFWGGALGSRSVTSTGTYSSSFTSNSTGRTNAVIGIYAVTETEAASGLPPSGRMLMGVGV